MLSTEFRIAPCRAVELGCGTGTNAVWLAQQGFDLTAVTNLSYAYVAINAGDYLLPAVTDISTASIYVNNGAKLALPGVTAVQNSQGVFGIVTLEAQGSNSLLDLRNMTSLTGSATYYTMVRVNAFSGGKVDLRGLTTVIDPVAGQADGRSFQFTANGANSLIDLSALTVFSVSP